MSLWTIDSQYIPIDFLGRNIEIEEVLVEFNEPLTFIVKNNNFEFLFHCVDDDERGINRYLVSAINEKFLTSLKSGMISIRDSFDKPPIYIVDMLGNEIKNSWMTSINAIPEDALPKENILLYPHLKPLIHSH